MSGLLGVSFKRIILNVRIIIKIKIERGEDFLRPYVSNVSKIYAGTLTRK